jgi:N-glycosylase/DNA lyase
VSARLAEVAAPDFDLAITLSCGQLFHWQRQGAGWVGAVGDKACYAEQRGDALFVTRGMEEIARRYFALDHPLAEIYESFPRDPAMDAALAACRGMRIVRQPHWECIASFITSAQKAVPHITQISHTLRSRFGKRIGDGSLFAYPTPAALAALEEDDLRACALGYRAKNLLRAARQIASGEVSLTAITKLDDESAHRELMRLGGVGPKVANCALLFAFERLAAFPIDVWIERVLRQIYFAKKRRVTAARLRDFAAKYFGAYGGYAQQYLFHHARTSRPQKS